MNPTARPYFGPIHPLDIDLADLVEGNLDERLRTQVSEHLRDCLLCRIKVRRLRQARGRPYASDKADAALEWPRFFVPDEEPRELAGDAVEGDVWSVGEDPRMLVVVTGLVDNRLLVAPLTFDVEAADDETIVVDHPHSPFPVSVAIYPMLATDISDSVLRARLGRFSTQFDLRSVLNGTAPGTQRGRAIVDATDSRLELRQELADGLGGLEEVPSDAGTTADAPGPAPEEISSSLASGLHQRRGTSCVIRRLSSWAEFEAAARREWVPIAEVEEVGVMLVVFDTPGGLNHRLDFEVARHLLTRFNCSALLVLASRVSELGDVFDAYGLHDALELPSGANVAPRPILSDLPPIDAATKFFDLYASVAAAETSTPTLTQIDVNSILLRAARSALDDALARRFQIAPKVRAYRSLERERKRFPSALQRVFRGESVVESIVALAEREKS
jgi:hypothetical protein